MRFRWLLVLSFCLCGSTLRADPPVASYIFPAGGKRGTTVKVRIGGLNLHDRCAWELVGPGVAASKHLVRLPTRWFEGPMLPLPASQQQEDYPRDVAGEVRIAADALPGVRRGRVWTSEGIAQGLAFAVGDLPEVIEEEMDGDPVPVAVALPVTINGRIFPRENVDVWSVTARKGQVITCEVHAERIGSPLDSRLEVFGPDGLLIAENDDSRGTDSLLNFTAPADGKYQVRISDSNRKGGPRFVYRLTITADPWVSHVYPLGGRRGTKTRFTLAGGNLPRTPVEVDLPSSASGSHLQGFSVSGKSTNAVAVDVDDLPEVLEAEPNDTPDKAHKVTLPAIGNGLIDRPGDVDCWRFAAHKGDKVALEMCGWRYGSPLRAVLEVLDDRDKVLARAGHQRPLADTALTFAVPADGDYTVKVRDFFRNRGGPAFAYRLKMTRPAGDFHLELLSHTVTVLRGKNAPLRLQVRRLGDFTGPVQVAIDGLPRGVKVSPLTLGPGGSIVNLNVTADKDTAVGVHLITIRGTATVAGKPVTRTAVDPGEPGEHPIDNVRLAVGLVAPFKIVGAYDLRLAPRGTVFRKRFKIERNGYTGPLIVQLADRQARHLQGVTGPVLTVPAGVNEIDYPVTLPPWMETGRTSRACVMAIGTVREGGIDHTVSYTSQAQNDQIIAVVETGRLGLELGRGSIAVTPGGTVSLPLTVRRGKGLTGAVTVALVVPDHVRGLEAEPLVLGVKEMTGKLVLKIAAGQGGPFNMPILVRATLKDSRGPVTAEARVEVVKTEK